MNFQKIGFVTFITCTLLILLANTGFSATYYVDATGGSNSNNGTSEVTSGETVAKVNSVSFASRDIIKFKRGETWIDATLTLAGVASAITGITIEDYGTGNKPRIDGNFVRPIVISKPNISNLTIRNIDVSGGGTYGSRVTLQYVRGLIIDGIDYNGATGTTSHSKCDCITIYFVGGDITIKNCTIQNLMKSTFDASLSAWGSSDLVGIIFWYPKTPKTDGTISIFNNVIHDVYTDCIHLGGIHTTTNIYDNKLYRFGENAIDMKYSRYITAYNNEFYHDDYGEASGSGWWGPPAIVSGSARQWTSEYAARDNVIRDNHFHTTKYSAIQVPGDNCKIYGNYFKNCGNGISVGSQSNTQIYNNVFELATGKPTVEPYASRWEGTQLSAIRLTSSAKAGTLVYNNTFYVSSDDLLYCIGYSPEPSHTGTIIKNNVMCMTRNSSSVYPLFVENATGDYPSVSNNVYYNSGRTNSVRWKGTTYSNTQESAFETASGSSVAIFRSPGLYDIENKKFWPSGPDSCVVDAGTALTMCPLGLHQHTLWPNNVQTILRENYGGHDIGAYEYVGAHSPNPILSPPTNMKLTALQ